jgi:hypothetical protein
MINKYPRRSGVNRCRGDDPVTFTRRGGAPACPESAVRRRTRGRHFDAVDTFDGHGRVVFRRAIGWP